jgi:3-methyl-2-oxobutanoate hydroxymethyltransferase
MPFGSYQESPEQAFRNAVTLMAAGAQMVKLEGGGDMAKTVKFLVDRGIPVCGHLGLTPQSVHAMGGYKVQGKGEAAAQRLRDDALALQDAGATMLVLEAIPAVLATEVTAMLHIITIGIGAGKDCSGQVWSCTTPSTSRRARKPSSSAISWMAPVRCTMPPAAPLPPSRTAATPARNTPTPHPFTASEGTRLPR